MRVGDLGELDGMVFVFGEEASAAFTMQNTVIPLDIAFFDRNGRLVDQLSMTPCESDPCPLYRASGTFAYALEMPAGTMGRLPRDTVISIDS